MLKMAKKGSKSMRQIFGVFEKSISMRQIFGVFFDKKSKPILTIKKKSKRAKKSKKKCKGVQSICPANGPKF